MHLAHSCVAASVIVRTQQKPHIGFNKTHTVPRQTANSTDDEDKTKDETMANATIIRTETFGIADRFAALIQDLQDRRARRKLFRVTLSELQGLGNRELRDLGLSRSQLRSVAWEHAYGAK